MFRFIKPQRTIFSLSRLPVKLEHRANLGQVQNVQRVRFGKPSFKTRFRNISISLLVFYVSAVVFAKVVLEPLDKAAEDALKHLPDDEEDEEVATSLFIPFPGTTKQLPVTPYRGSDPEWQEFIKFSQDLTAGKKVRDELAQIVRQVADRNPTLQVRFGKGVKLRRYWLDIDFPTHPPPEFERTGIEVADEYIALSTMPVDSSTVFRLRQVLWPSALMQSVWAFAKVMVIDDIGRLTRYFGVEPTKRPISMEQIIAQVQAKQQESIKIKGLPTAAGPKPNQPESTEAQKSKAIKSLPEKAKVTGKGNREADGDEKSSTQSATAIQAHFIKAIFAFKQKFAKTWRPAPALPPRGSIVVSGLVELDMPKAWFVFDIKAHWDPKSKAFDPRSMVLKLRRMQLKRQAAVGGN